MKRTAGFIAITVLLVLVSAFCITETVKSQSSKDMEISEEYYRQAEKQYVKEMREYLGEAGFSNSGIMLTRTVFADGSREYRITVHNSRFDNLKQEEKEELIDALKQRAFQEENCSFAHSLEGNA